METRFWRGGGAVAWVLLGGAQPRAWASLPGGAGPPGFLPPFPLLRPGFGEEKAGFGVAWEGGSPVPSLQSGLT